jgi:predicted transcriptional regulator
MSSTTQTGLAVQSLAEVCDRIRNRAITNGLAKQTAGERLLHSERHYLRKAGLLVEVSA